MFRGFQRLQRLAIPTPRHLAPALLCASTSMNAQRAACEEPAASCGLSPSELSRWDRVVKHAKNLQIEVVSDHPPARLSSLWSLSWLSKYQASPLQVYFMHKVDFEVGAAFPTFYVSNALNDNGDSIAALHAQYHQDVGGVSGTIVPGNKAGYIGGLTGNKAIAEILYSPRKTSAPQISGDQSRDELVQYLVENAKHSKKFKNLSEAELHKSCEGFVYSKDLSFRNYVDMRTRRTVHAVMKEDVPLFAPSAWEELHGLLRDSAFCGGVSQQLSNSQRMFSSSSDTDLNGPKDVLIGNFVECFLVDDRVICRHPRAEVPKELIYAIECRMKALKLRYCNAVYEGVTSIEDCGFAFFHILDFELADQRFAHPRNKGLVYTVAPNGNRKRYPNDVPVLPSVDAWQERMQLIGRNIARSVMLYNEFVKRQDDASWSPLTALRVNNVGGGMFLLQDDEGKPMISGADHTKYFLAGLVLEFIRSPCFAVKRLEIMRPAPTADKIDGVTLGFMGFIEEQAL